MVYELYPNSKTRTVRVAKAQAEDTGDAARAFGYFNVQEATLSPRRWERRSVGASPEGPGILLATAKRILMSGWVLKFPVTLSHSILQ